MHTQHTYGERERYVNAARSHVHSGSNKYFIFKCVTPLRTDYTISSCIGIRKLLIKEEKGENVDMPA